MRLRIHTGGTVLEPDPRCYSSRCRLTANRPHPGRLLRRAPRVSREACGTPRAHAHLPTQPQEIGVSRPLPRAGAPILRRHLSERLLHVVAAPFPGGLVAGGAGDPSTHEVLP